MVRRRKERQERAPVAADRVEEAASGIPPRSAPPHVQVHLDSELVARACRRTVARGLAEDLAVNGDLTSIACVRAGTHGAANIIVRTAGVVAGLSAVNETFSQVDGRTVVRTEVADGDQVEAGAVVARVQGPLRSILTAERTALNLLGHLSGIATLTRAFVESVRETGCVVRDTRKTMPGLRLLEKAAVVAGGGASHRLGLHDALLVKDSHIVAAGGVGAATRSALARAGEHPVQVEVTTVQEVDEAVAAGARDLLLDNLTPDDVRRMVAAVAGRAAVEASGGITLANVRAYAEAGADRVAVGALTHSAPWLDVALELDATSIGSAFSGAATHEAVPRSSDVEDEAVPHPADVEEQAEPILAKPREMEPAFLAPEPDPAAGPLILVEDVREVPLSDAHPVHDELVHDGGEPGSGSEEFDGPNQSAG